MLSGKRGIGTYMLREIAKAVGRPVYDLVGAPPPVELPSGELSTLAAHLKRLRVPRNPAFEQYGCFEDNADRKAVGSILSVNNLQGAIGLPVEMISVVENETPPQYAAYIEEEIDRTKVEGRDGNKVALTNWRQLPFDAEGGRMHLVVAPTKYRSKIAMRNLKPRIIRDLTEHRVRILGHDDGREWLGPLLPCHLHCDGLVLTGDSKVLLAQRSRNVDIEALQWAASFGESVDWDADRDEGGALSPLRTILRGLDEELGLSESWQKARFGSAAKITFIELAFHVESVIYILFSIIELPQLGMEEALDILLQRRITAGPSRPDRRQ